MIVNSVIARLLEETATMMELLGENSFRIAALARAARFISDLNVDLAAIADDRPALLSLEGIGEKIADKIQEYVRDGRIREHEEYAEQIPVGLLELMRIPGLGPKTVRLLWQKKQVESVEDLKRIIADGSLLELPRMGKKTVENIKAAIEFSERSGERTPLGLALPAAESIVERLRKVPGAERVEHAGSLRRGRDTIGDIDIMACAGNPDALTETFRTLEGVTKILAAGATKSSVRMKLPDGRRDEQIQVDLRIVSAASFGAAWLYFTGSKDHNVRLRERAIKAGMTLNEYGLFKDDRGAGSTESKLASTSDKPPQERGAEPIAAVDEHSIYMALGLPFLPPEIREGAGEFAWTESNPPRLIELNDIKAELHAHTTASDGSLTIEELAAEAQRRGFHTVAVTDHSQSQRVANGLSPERLREHIRAVRTANETINSTGATHHSAGNRNRITILAGSEVDIHADGSLDYDDELLQELDLIVASPHWALTQTAAQATARLLKAIEHPLVDIVGHPTGRLIGKREGMKPAIANLAAAAKEHNTALEINAHWMRLDLRDTHVRTAIECGALIAINCDVHAPSDFDNLRYGVLTARRGWASPESCISAWTATKLHAWLSTRRNA